jgi:hypothetical protein
MVSAISVSVHHLLKMVDTGAMFWKDQGIFICSIPSFMGLVLRASDTCTVLLLGKKGV